MASLASEWLFGQDEDVWPVPHALSASELGGFVGKMWSKALVSMSMRRCVPWEGTQLKGRFVIDQDSQDWYCFFLKIIINICCSYHFNPGVVNSMYISSPLLGFQLKCLQLPIWGPYYGKSLIVSPPASANLLWIFTWAVVKRKGSC